MWQHDGPEPKKAVGWVVFLDVFGFRAMLDARDGAELQGQLARCRVRMFGMPEWKDSPPHVYTLSDSVFLLYEVPSPVEKLPVLKRCREDVEELLGIFAEEKLPLRGGISFGEVIFGPFVLIGQPVARAVEYEGRLPVPLVLLPAKELADAAGEGIVWLPNMTDIDLKDAHLMHGVLLSPSPIDPLIGLAEEELLETRIHGPYHVAKAWSETLSRLQLVKEERDDFAQR